MTTIMDTYAYYIAQIATKMTIGIIIPSSCSGVKCKKLNPDSADTFRRASHSATGPKFLASTVCMDTASRGNDCPLTATKMMHFVANQYQYSQVEKRAC